MWSILTPTCLFFLTGGPPWPQERTLVAVKPDGVQRRLVGTVIQRFERRGFKLVGMKMLQVSPLGCGVPKAPSTCSCKGWEVSIVGASFWSCVQKVPQTQDTNWGFILRGLVSHLFPHRHQKASLLSTTGTYRGSHSTQLVSAT